MKPLLSGKLPRGCASAETPYGPVRVAWEHGEDAGVLQIEIPPNTQAEILLEPYIDVRSCDGLAFKAEGGVQKALAGSGIRTIQYGINKIQ